MRTYLSLEFDTSIHANLLIDSVLVLIYNASSIRQNKCDELAAASANRLEFVGVVFAGVHVVDGVVVVAKCAGHLIAYMVLLDW